MGKFKSIFFCALLNLTLASCTKDSGIWQDEAEPSQPQNMTTTIRAAFAQGAETYAQTTFASEKRLFSVAFFVYTPSDGKLHKFFHLPDQTTDYPFDDVTTASGNRTVIGTTFTLQGEYTGSAILTIIGNFDNYGGSGNDFAESLMNVETIEELNAFTLAAPAASPKIRLLTYWQGDITLQNHSAIDIKTKRVAARITLPFDFIVPGRSQPLDLNTLMYPLPGRPKLAECFVLVYHPKSATYLLPTTDAQIDAIPQLERYEPIAYDPNARHFQFYTYEMTGNDAHKLTAYVILKLRDSEGSPWTEQMYSLTLEGKESGLSRFERNCAYDVESPYKFTVDTNGWDDGMWNIVGIPKTN